MEIFQDKHVFVNYLKQVLPSMFIETKQQEMEIYGELIQKRLVFWTLDGVQIRIFVCL